MKENCTHILFVKETFSLYVSGPVSQSNEYAAVINNHILTASAYLMKTDVIDALSLIT